MCSGRPISGPWNSHLEQGDGTHSHSRTFSCTRGSCIKVCVQSKASDSSAASDTAAVARRLFHKSFKFLSNHTDIPPHKGSVASHRRRKKPLKEIPFQSYLFTPLCAPPHDSDAFHPPERCWYPGLRYVVTVCRQRRRQGRGLACGRINFLGFTNICGWHGNGGQMKLF